MRHLGLIVPFDADKVQNGIVKVVAVGLGGKKLDTACI
jgi:hypothetical protein